MAKFWIYINENKVGEINGCEAAWEAYRNAVNLCEIIGAECGIVDAETGEVIEFFDYDAE